MQLGNNIVSSSKPTQEVFSFFDRILFYLCYLADQQLLGFPVTLVFRR